LPLTLALPSCDGFETTLSSDPRIKIAANKPEVLYQSLIKTWLAEKNENTLTI
jgi:hypothetical protein